MSRSHRVTLSLLASVFVVVSAAIFVTGMGACQPSGVRPNVVLITMDTLRADYLSSYGFSHPTSPNLDALGAQGVIFERAIAASSTTSPSHASILTSRHTREHSVGFYSGPTALEGLRTLAEHFRDAGYETAAFVGNINLEARLGFARGFDHFDDDLPSVEANRPLQYERIAEHTYERARAWIAQHGDEPFFLWVHFQDPHGPYDPPPDHLGRIRVEDGASDRELPVLEKQDGPGGIPRYQALDGVRHSSQYRSRYADEILYADAFLGALIESVDTHSSSRETIVLLTADHGEAMGENDVWFSHFLHSTPQLAHVPMILRAPGIEPARRPEPVGHVDVLPTLLELAGLEVPEDARGIALGPHLRDGSAPPDRFVICDAGEEVSAYRSDSFVRAVELKEVWRENPSPLDPKWAAYTWDGRGNWERITEDSDENRLITRDMKAMSRYFSSAQPMVGAPEAEPEHEERLRALGYVE
ncbi:sulfatase [Myxococcota bacterium]|nr:sulfatase [Myxococcota bacterium]